MQVTDDQLELLLKLDDVWARFQVRLWPAIPTFHAKRPVFRLGVLANADVLLPCRLVWRKLLHA